MLKLFDVLVIVGRELKVVSDGLGAYDTEGKEGMLIRCEAGWGCMGAFVRSIWGAIVKVGHFL